MQNCPIAPGSFIGKPWNFTTGDWQISRVYAALNQPDLALSFAKKALETSQKHNLSERLISAYEGMARAHAVAREYPLAREFVSKAREQLRAVSLDDEIARHTRIRSMRQSG